MDINTVDLGSLSLEELSSLIIRTGKEPSVDPALEFQRGKAAFMAVRKCWEEARSNYRSALSLNPSFQKSLKNLELLDSMVLKLDPNSP
ncbi:MAG: hypothetical protein A2142_00865 [candidate division Zixibacteria bacterium RBG_16_48_11]|nr:MAG: hypothetical protein A2142_00865 [candidate division Zixibacteria bacterium RBG_16_48_11]